MLWREEYKTGIDFIDEQHKKLFELTDSLVELLKNQLMIDKYDRIVEAVVELREYTVYHFDTEEKYMKSIKYSKRFEQRIEHEKFKVNLNKLSLDDIDLNHDASILELIDMVSTWLKEHIIEKDKQIYGFINK